MTNDPEIDIRLLRCLTALVTLRSVSRAADQLGSSQPAMSHSLARLRQIFGDPILTRGTGGLTPTARALELDKMARSVLSEVTKMTSLSTPFDPQSTPTTLVLTSTEYVESVLAGSLSSALLKEAPHVRVVFRPPDRSQIVAWLERGEVDLRLGYVHEPNPILRQKLLFEEKLVVIARKGHPIIKDVVTLDQYRSAGHVTSEIDGWTTSGRAIDDVLGDIGLRREKCARLQSALTVPSVVASSDLIATVPRRLAQRYGHNPDLQMLALPMKVAPFRCSAYWHDSVHRDPRHKWLRNIVIRVARKLTQMNE